MIISNIQAMLNNLVSNDAYILTSDVQPDNNFGKGIAGPGSLCIGTMNSPYLYINVGTKEAPNWKWYIAADELGIWYTTGQPVFVGAGGVSVTCNTASPQYTNYLNQVGQMMFLVYSYDLTIASDIAYFTLDTHGDKFRSFVSAPVSEANGTGGVVECPKDDARLYFYRNSAHTGVWTAGNHKIYGQVIYPWYYTELGVNWPVG